MAANSRLEMRRTSALTVSGRERAGEEIQKCGRVFFVENCETRIQSGLQPSAAWTKFCGREAGGGGGWAR